MGTKSLEAENRSPVGFLSPGEAKLETKERDDPLGQAGNVGYSQVRYSQVGCSLWQHIRAQIMDQSLLWAKKLDFPKLK